MTSDERVNRSEQYVSESDPARKEKKQNQKRKKESAEYVEFVYAGKLFV